jgi:phosphorylcholine metabolism protein LicD
LRFEKFNKKNLKEKTNIVIHQPRLTDKNLIRARKVLFDVIDFLESENIEYHLEGGTLLGIVRDGELLPWDHDIDLSILVKDAKKLAKKAYKLFFKGYRVTRKKINRDIEGFKKGNYRIFKVKKFLPSILKGIFPIFNKHMIVADIFVKFVSEKNTYWQAMGKVMRVDNSFYSSSDSVEYMGKVLNAPYNHTEYLSEKYGDWKITVKEWECGIDERTIVAAI